MGANQSGTPDGVKPEAAAKAAAAPAAEPSASAEAAKAAQAAKPAAASSTATSTPAPAAEVPKAAASAEPAEDAADATDEAEGFALCVRKLGEDVTTEKLKAVFEAKGPVVKAEVKMNEAGKCRGLGIIIVPTKEEADKVISNASAYEVDGKPVDIRPTKGRGKGRERSQKGTEQEGPAAAAAPAAAPPTTPKGGKAGKSGKGKGKAEGKGGKTSLAQAAGAPEFVPGQYNDMQREMYEAQQKYMRGMAQQYYMYQAMWQAAYMQQYGGQQAAAAAAAGQGANASLAAGQAQAQQAASGTPAGKGRKGEKKKGSGKAAAGKEANKKQDERVEVAADKVFNGTLKSVSQRNGYGFLASTEAYSLWGRDVYVDAKTELEPNGIKLNDEVTFSVVLSEKNHPQAQKVKKAS